jgi:hypothetical protein
MIPAIHQFAWQLILAAQALCGGTDYVIANMPFPLGEPETVVLAENGKVVVATKWDNGWFEEVGKCGEFGIYERMEDSRALPFAIELKEQQNEFEMIVRSAMHIPQVEESIQDDDQ